MNAPPSARRLAPLTKRQREVVEVIWARVRKRQAPPTRRELAKQLGHCGTNGVLNTLKAIMRKGWLERDDERARGLRLTKRAKRHLGGIPLLDWRLV